jgi:glycosyltransferase A (GT-A) superfamily protein (DUF2064 family)
MSAATSVLVVAEDAAAATVLPGVDRALIERLLVEHAARWAARWAPGRARVIAATGALPAGVQSIDPAGEDRGERIAAAAATTLDARGGPLLIVSAAFPGLGPAHAGAALDDLANGCDVTLGPSTAGDWYLLGLRSAAPALMQSLAAGADAAATMRAAALAGLAFGMLRSERPLRSVADAAALRADPLAGPELLAALG